MYTASYLELICIKELFYFRVNLSVVLSFNDLTIEVPSLTLKHRE